MCLSTSKHAGMHGCVRFCLCVFVKFNLYHQQALYLEAGLSSVMTVPFHIKTKHPTCNQITNRNVLLFHIANVSCSAAGDVLGVSKPSTDKSVHHPKKRQVHVMLAVILKSNKYEFSKV